MLHSDRCLVILASCLEKAGVGHQTVKKVDMNFFDKDLEKLEKDLNDQINLTLLKTL